MTITDAGEKIEGPEFKVTDCDGEHCFHDTGVGHSMGMPCEIAEMLADLMHARESDPRHHATWHEGMDEGVLDARGNRLQMKTMRFSELDAAGV